MTNVRAVGIGLCMLFAAGLAFALTPTEKLADSAARARLEELIPREFAGWRIDPTVVPLTSPDVEARLRHLYTETLARTYINARGERMMLSIAYGVDQRDGLQVHKPESCYPAQGFKLLGINPGVLDTRFGAIPVFRLETAKGPRWEPVTYWTTVGDKVVAGSMQRKLAELHYARDGVIADGLLFRVSSIDRDSADAFARQSAFTGALLEAVDPATRRRLAGLEEPG
ncbi:MAG: exosortase-associated protein EpsI, B-type [Burkholderiales bacterium]